LWLVAVEAEQAEAVVEEPVVLVVPLPKQAAVVLYLQL
jgi:hypothetical protein